MLGWRVRLRPDGCQLPLANRVQDRDARQRPLSRPTRLEAYHRPDQSFHGSMSLLHESVEICALDDSDPRVVDSVVPLKLCDRTSLNRRTKKLSYTAGRTFNSYRGPQRRSACTRDNSFP